MLSTIRLSIMLFAVLSVSAIANGDAPTGQLIRSIKLDDKPAVPGGNYDKFGWSAAAKLTYKALVPKGLRSTAVVYVHHLPANVPPRDALTAMHDGFASGRLKWARIGETSGMLEVPPGLTLVNPEKAAAQARRYRIVSFARDLLPGHDTGAEKWVTFAIKRSTPEN
ncbi:MAG: hypothetical protein JXQ99_21470 [Hyphomicrobiaceae bacterium]